MTDKWITVKPNGQNNTGRPALIGEGGVIKGGMGGKFNGEKISEVRKDFTGAKTPKKIENLNEEIKSFSEGKKQNSAFKMEKLDHGVLSMPNRTKNINNELDKYKAEQQKIKKRELEDRKFLNSQKQEAKNEVMNKAMTDSDKKTFKKELINRMKDKFEKAGYSKELAAEQAKVYINQLFKDKPDVVAKAWKNDQDKKLAQAGGQAQDMAMDFQALTTARHKDGNGHLIVDRTCITKAAINPYKGKEIPNWQALGLDPNKVYMLLRCPAELQRALPTFQGLQLLERHTPVSSEEPEKDSTVGSIGTVVEMDGDNVYSSLRVYDQNAIDLIESEKLNQLSAGYAYTADMTGGEWNGEHYDGVMRNIHGNHVALVERGRIGKDAIIADEMPNEIEEFLMSKKIALKKGSLSKLQEQLGMDSAEELKKTIIAVVGQLAHDEDKEEKEAEDEDDEKKSDAEDEEVIEVAEDEDDGEKADKERKALEKTDKDDDEAKKDDKKGQAMDAAMIESNAVAKVTALFEAREKVKPIVGQIACDSAEEVYKTALAKSGVSTKGIHPSAYGAMVDLVLQGKQNTPNIAQDSAYASASTGLKSITGHIRKG